jgi:hypothetical protein
VFFGVTDVVTIAASIVIVAAVAAVASATNVAATTTTPGVHTLAYRLPPTIPNYEYRSPEI